ncbi:magnesium and cobalt transport protein CorA [Methylococcus sp. EFPC2]|uniref:magnesium and cobalt transport protein CorA n=1 Tax=Methylococcus sp. EFPC2 TaxID=2812648 RepID=UPI0019676D12|nr:magnesium and cobalt transport protein CorA [Methylococcus sp. EFPC2]QSA97881.1 magnesium and cobalt transport protein CorA [Methylococcus sp. EFPC2]
MSQSALTPSSARKAYSSMLMSCVLYRQGRRVGDLDIEDISEVVGEPDTLVWMELREPDQALLEKIQAEFGLHELAVEDARNARQRPKLEAYGESLFVVLQTAQFIGKDLRIGETHVFVGPRFFITIRHGSSLSYQKVRERCDQMPDRLAKGTGFALYALMDFIVDHYMPVVHGLDERFDRLEEDIFKNRSSQATLEQLYELKSELQRLRAAVSPMQNICNELMHFHGDILAGDGQFYFRDVSDHAERISQAIDGMREMLLAAMQVYLALMTVGQNEIVKRLAGWGAILALPTMVFSLYGMNFHHMPELDWEYGYPAILGGLLALSVGLYWRLKIARWL